MPPAIPSPGDRHAPIKTSDWLEKAPVALPAAPDLHPRRERPLAGAVLAVQIARGVPRDQIRLAVTRDVPGADDDVVRPAPAREHLRPRAERPLAGAVVAVQGVGLVLREQVTDAVAVQVTDADDLLVRVPVGVQLHARGQLARARALVEVHRAGRRVARDQVRAAVAADVAGRGEDVVLVPAAGAERG